MRSLLLVALVATLVATVLSQDVVTVGSTGSVGVVSPDGGPVVQELESVECSDANGCFVVVHPRNGAGDSFDATMVHSISNHLPQGVSLKVNVTESVDYSAGNAYLYFMLHVDSNNNGVYDGPGTDVPVDVASEATNPCAPFILMGQAVVGTEPVPSLDFGTPGWTQIYDTSNGLFISQVVAPLSSFVVVHAATDLAVLGSVSVPHGVSEGVWVPLTGASVGMNVTAMLHIDADPNDGAYNPSIDVPAGPSALVAGSSINPEVTLLSADAIDINVGPGSLVSSWVTVDGKASILGTFASSFFGDANVGIYVDSSASVDRFLVAHNDLAPTVGSGFAVSSALSPGKHVCALLDVDYTAYDIISGGAFSFMLHEDTNGNGVYDDGTDQPILPFTETNFRAVNTLAIMANVSSVIDLSADHDVAANAACSGGPAVEVFVPASTFVSGSSFVVVHRDDSGSFGSVIGAAFVAHGAGSGTGHVCLTEAVEEGEQLWAMLHIKGDGECVGVLDTDYTPASDSPYPTALVEGDTLKKFNVGSINSAVINTPQAAVPAGPNTVTVVTDINGDHFIAADSVQTAGDTDGYYIVVHPSTGDDCTATFDATAVLNDPPALIDTPTTVCQPTFELSSVAVGDALWLMVHYENNGNTVYNGAAVDPFLELSGVLTNPRVVVDTIISQQVAVDATNLTNTELLVSNTALRDLNIGYGVSVGSSFIVVHEDNSGSFGDVIGASAAISHGLNNDISITLDRDTVDGETLWLMLHVDTDPCDGTAYVPANDPPVTTTEGPALVPVTVKHGVIASSSDSSDSSSSSDATATTVSMLIVALVAMMAAIVA